jgi:hypothetical protein
MTTNRKTAPLGPVSLAGTAMKPARYAAEGLLLLRRLTLLIGKPGATKNLICEHPGHGGRGVRIVGWGLEVSYEMELLPETVRPL